jgi:hypothetical protein
MNCIFSVFFKRLRSTDFFDASKIIIISFVRYSKVKKFLFFSPLDITESIEELKRHVHLLEIDFFEFEDRSTGCKRGKGGFVSLS